MQNQCELPQAAVVAAASGSERFSQPTVAIILLIATLSLFVVQPSRAQSPAAKLNTNRVSPLDLELGGDLAKLPSNSTRYITREDLLALPQVNFTVVDDANFTGPTQVSGISLEELVRRFAAAPDSDLTLAICDDKYLASYPRAYIAAHHPVLVLKINGQPPSAWPKDSEGHNLDIGPLSDLARQLHPQFQNPLAFR